MTKPVRRPGSPVYYARRAIPKKLRQALGRTEIWLSLRTTDLEAAKPLERRQQLQWDAEFAAAQNKLGPRPQTAYLPAADIDGEALDAQFRHWAEWDAMVEADPLLQAKMDLTALVRDEVFQREAQIFLKEDRASGKPGKAGTSLSAVVDRWAKAKPMRVKTIDRMAAVVSWFEDMIGQHTVEAITPDEVLRFKDALLAKTSRANANTKLRNFNTLMRFAVREARIIKLNPAADITISVTVDPEEEVQPFDLSALKSIFGSPVYLSDARPLAGSGEAAYWLPLLALYTGARLNELGQLRPKDILQLPYVDEQEEERQAWVIRIVADKADGLRLKNKWSARRLPIHSELIRLGFLAYVATMEEQGQSRIFPELRPDKYDTITANWSKWFGRYLRGTCGVADERMVFHSFRHAFKDYARESEIAEDVSDAISGHRGQAVARKYGSSLSFPLRPMVSAMKRYRVTGFSPPASPPVCRGELTKETVPQVVE